MDWESIRKRAEAHARALAASDFTTARQDFLTLDPSLAEALAALPHPVTSVEVVSVVDLGGECAVRTRLAGVDRETVLESRWVERDGRPAMLSARAVG